VTFQSSKSFNEIINQVSSSKKDYFSQLLLSLRFAKSLKQADSEQLALKSLYLQKKRLYENCKTLIFDLDETLVHCCENPRDGERKVSITLPSGDKLEVGINIRPFAVECLTQLSKRFEIIVFTASHQCYADKVLDLIDPKREIIHHRLYRDNCLLVDGVYVKDLRILTNRNLKDVVLVDNSAYCFAYQMENGIPIVSWYNDRDDSELVELMQYLSGLGKVQDVRIVNRETFHLTHISNNSEVIMAKM
jgi:CTD small phosphatase-like protein 2